MVSNRDILTSPRVIEIKRAKRKTRRRILILFLILFLIFLGVLIAGLAYLSNWEKIIIKKINVSGNHIIDQKDIKKVAEENISGKYLHLFARNNFLIYPKNIIYKDLIDNFPRVEKLTISLDGFNTLNIVLGERSGSFLWCGEVVPQSQDQVGENCFFVNNDGYIFDKAPYFSGDLYFKFYLPLKASGNLILGKQMLPKEEFVSLVKFIDAINSLNLEPAYLVFNSDGTRNIYLYNSESTVAPKIMFNEKNDLVKIADNLSLAMKKPEFADEIKSKYNTLLYIDLRFDNKVLYKFSQ